MSEVTGSFKTLSLIEEKEEESMDDEVLKNLLEFEIRKAFKHHGERAKVKLRNFMILTKLYNVNEIMILHTSVVCCLLFD